MTLENVVVLASIALGTAIAAVVIGCVATYLASKRFDR